MPTRVAVVVVALLMARASFAAEPADVVDASTLRGKVLCGYQGWFRCPGDAAGGGWVHWSRDGRRLAPETLTFEMWPDMTDYTAAERFAAPGFTYPDGQPAHLFSSDNGATVLRHFEWMREYGIDGVFLQRFVGELPAAGADERRYASRARVLAHVAEAARKTGRAWAVTYDLTGMPAARAFDVLTANWKRLVDEKVTADPRYLHEGGRPVVQVFGFYGSNTTSGVTPELAERLIEFFRAEGPYRAFVAGAGEWYWRKNRDPKWQAVYRKLDAYSPWNVGNTARAADGAKTAATGYWAEDKAEFERGGGGLWMPVVYPGFSWDNLQRKEAGATAIPRRGGRFLWEQFAVLGKLKPGAVFVAMFDEVDEGTAVFKVTSAPPTPGHFVGYEGLPSDWYLRLVGEGTRRLRAGEGVPGEIPIRP